MSTCQRWPRVAYLLPWSLGHFWDFQEHTTQPKLHITKISLPKTPHLQRTKKNLLASKGESELIAETDSEKKNRINPPLSIDLHPPPTAPQNPQRGSVTAAVGGAGPSRSREAASAKRWKALAARCKDGDGGAGPQSHEDGLPELVQWLGWAPQPYKTYDHHGH